MARTNNLTNFLTDVAGAIKEKKGSEANIPAANFDTEIRNLPSQGTYEEKTISITQNGTQTVTPSQGYDAIDELTINANVQPSLQSKSYSFTQNTTTTITPEQGYDGFSSIGLEINVPSGSGDVKLFDTVEHMQADPDAEEGDLAVVYREELTGIDENSEFSSCTFPNTVVLSSAYSDSAYCRFRATDGGWFDGMVDMSSSSFRFNGYGESSNVRVQYTSSDGITYTRTDGGEELVDFGTTIQFENYGDPFPEVISNFMKIGGNYFEGLYDFHEDYVDNNQFKFYDLSSVSISGTTGTVGNTIGDYYDVSKLSKIYDKIINEFGNSGYTKAFFYLNNNMELCFIMATTSNGLYTASPLYDTNGNFMGIGSPDTTFSFGTATYKVTDINEGTYVLLNTYDEPLVWFDGTSQSMGKYYYIPLTDIRAICVRVANGYLEMRKMFFIYNNSTINTFSSVPDNLKVSDTYLYVKSQFTLSDTNQLFPGIIGYGKNGVITGDGSIWDNIPENTIDEKAINTISTTTNLNDIMGTFDYLNERKDVRTKDNYPAGRIMIAAKSNEDMNVICTLAKKEDILTDFRTKIKEYTGTNNNYSFVKIINNKYLCFYYMPLNSSTTTTVSISAVRYNLETEEFDWKQDFTYTSSITLSTNTNAIKAASRYLLFYWGNRSSNNITLGFDIDYENKTISKFYEQSTRYTNIGAGYLLGNYVYILCPESGKIRFDRYNLSNSTMSYKYIYSTNTNKGIFSPFVQNNQYFWFIGETDYLKLYKLSIDGGTITSTTNILDISDISSVGGYTDIIHNNDRYYIFANPNIINKCFMLKVANDGTISQISKTGWTIETKENTSGETLYTSASRHKL